MLHHTKLFYTGFVLLVVLTGLRSSDSGSGQNEILTRWDSLGVGNVVYSILSESDFIRLNGPGWRLVNGDTLPQNSLLRVRFGIVALPNAQGTFIRCMPVDTAKTHQLKRKVGSIEEETDLAHDHFIDTNHPDVVSGGPKPPDQPGVKPATPLHGIVNRMTHKAGYTKNDTIDLHPRNIVLYAYIKDYVIPQMK